MVEHVEGTTLDVRLVRPDLAETISSLVLDQLRQSLAHDFPFPLRVAVSVAGNRAISRDCHSAVARANAAASSVGSGLVNVSFISEFYDDSGDRGRGKGKLG